MQKCLEVYHTNVHIILRRNPWPPVQTGGNRALHVLHTLFREPNVSCAQLLERVRPKKYPAADKVSLKLLGKGKRTSTIVKLSEALARLEPFSYLVQTEAGTEKTPGKYQIQKFPDPGLNNNGRKIGPSSKNYYKRNGRSKEVYINPDCSADLLRLKLKLSYHFLLEGSRVEWHLRPKSSLTEAETVDWALRHQLHLRPDAILAAMPPGTTMLAVPGMLLPSHPRNPLTKALSKVKTSEVFWAMENGPELLRRNVHTPRQVRQLGTWTEHTKFVEAIEPGNTRPSEPHESRPFGEDPDREMEEGDMPDLSDLMPERERNDDGSSRSNAPPKPKFRIFRKSGRK